MGDKPSLKSLVEAIDQNDISEDDESLAHYGTPRHSGRYPWGSGKNPQRSRGWMSRYRELKDAGMTDADIAKSMGMRSSSELRARRAMHLEEERSANYAFAKKLRDKGMSHQAIADRMGFPNESSVRSLLASGGKLKENGIKNTAMAIADISKNSTHGYLDVGAGSNLSLNVTANKFNDAIEYLKYSEGYSVIKQRIPQLGTNHYTEQMILVPPGKTVKEAYQELKGTGIEKVQPVEGIKMIDNGQSSWKLHDPVNIDSKRVGVKYAEEGGKDMDGVIEIRPGVQELSLGENHYAQVRIGVDDNGTKLYAKGMAVYGDPKKMPAGVDIVVNTNKHHGDPLTKVLKSQKEEGTASNPFGATIDRQNDWVDESGKEHHGALNIVNEEGTWNTWSKNLASQFLSKQSKQMAKRQLNIAAEIKEDQFEDIMSLTNGTLKKQLLKEFGDECDSAAVHLKAAALPRQTTRVILPVPSLKENEVYAPSYDNGEQVALVRYPHGGTFEIPILTVNNNNREGNQRITKTAKDAIGIHPSAAERLSGADFDGDSVIVIPLKGQNIKSTPQLEGLKNFDPKEAYPSFTAKSAWEKGSDKEHIEMGKVSNLITDMTLQDAPPDEIARAVRHSMTIIDTGKHNLDWKASEIDNGIEELKQKYQGGGGASTLISKAKSKAYVDYRNPNQPYKIDPETGKKVFQTTKKQSDLYYYKDGKREKRQTTSTQMYETDDAYTLSSGTPMESIYAEYANRMKALGDRARRAIYTVQETAYNKDAAVKYAKEVESLKEQLRKAELNAPRERNAQRIGIAKVREMQQNNPDMTKEERKKIKNVELDKARHVTGADKYRVTFSESEWEAVMAGAINKTTLSKLFKNADDDHLKTIAMPKTATGMPKAKLTRAKALLKNGNYSWSEVADMLDVSVSTLQRNIDLGT